MNRRLLTLATLLVALPAAAQQKIAPAEQAPADIPFRVIGQTQISLGDHKLILNRVTPPVLPEKQTVAAQVIPPLSAEAAQTALRREWVNSAYK